MSEGGARLQQQSYELNLVLNAGGLQRECVACMGDDDWVRQAGRAVAEFLGVPVIEAGPG